MTPERLLTHSARKRVPQSSHKICWVQADPLDANWWLGGFLGHDLTKFANQHFHNIYDVIKLSDDCSCHTQFSKIESFSLIFQKYQKPSICFDIEKSMIYFMICTVGST